MLVHDATPHLSPSNHTHPRLRPSTLFPVYRSVRSHTRIRFPMHQQANPRNPPLLSPSSLSSLSMSALSPTTLFALHSDPLPIFIRLVGIIRISRATFISLFHLGHPVIFRTRISSRPITPYTFPLPPAYIIYLYSPPRLVHLFLIHLRPATNPKKRNETQIINTLS